MIGPITGITCGIEQLQAHQTTEKVTGAITESGLDKTNTVADQTRIETNETQRLSGPVSDISANSEINGLIQLQNACDAAFRAIETMDLSLARTTRALNISG